MSTETVISLRQEFFSETERTFLRHGELSVSLFRYGTGVAGVRISNARGEIVVLPFQGQQIWDARFDGRTLTMKSLFTEPQATRDFVATYGAFLLHCGITAMGNPGPQENLPGPSPPSLAVLGLSARDPSWDGSSGGFLGLRSIHNCSGFDMPLPVE